jgi:hypothetical protein
MGCGGSKEIEEGLEAELDENMQETGVETDEQESDPAWPHIRGVYEIFLQLIVVSACGTAIFIFWPYFCVHDSLPEG